MFPIAAHKSLEEGPDWAPAWFLNEQDQLRRERRQDRIEMHLRFSLRDQWQAARYSNMHLQRDENLIAPLSCLPPVPAVDDIDVDGPLVIPQLLPPPATFPATIGDLLALTGPQLTELLAAYGLPTNGDRGAKQARFVSHLGIRPLR